MARGPSSTNVAILTGALLMPVVVAAGFLSERLDRPAVPAAIVWPDLRGTFDGASVPAADDPARLSSAPRR
jgi:hypothetical protein